LKQLSLQLDHTTMMFRPSTIVCFLLFSASAVLAQDPCATEDAALDMCLEQAGASDLVKDTCDACIEDIKARLATSATCDDADADACGAFASCECLGCATEAIIKGECEMDAERASNGINCPSIMCDGAEGNGGGSTSTGGGSTSTGEGSTSTGVNVTENGEFSSVSRSASFSADSSDGTNLLGDATTTVVLSALDSAACGPSKMWTAFILATFMVAGALV
jgi:hypothetical protein